MNDFTAQKLIKSDLRNDLKVIKKFFLKATTTKILDGISGIAKNIFFFHLKACERRNFDFCVFLRMCSVMKYLQIVFSR